MSEEDQGRGAAWDADLWVKDGWALWDKSRVKPCIYFFSYSWENKPLGIAYFGQTTNPRRRFESHEIVRFLRSRGFEFQHWFKHFPAHELKFIESFFISQYNPPLNLAGRKRELITPGRVAR